MEAEEDFKAVEEVGVETEEAEFREDGIKVVVEVVIKIEVVAIKTGVEAMEEAVIRIEEVAIKIEEAVIRIVEVVTRIEEAVIRIEEVVVMEVATRIEGVVEEGVVVVEAEGGTITIDGWSRFPGICL